MKERPILFSAPMVKAILAGRKTVTRRVVTVPWKGSRRALPYSPYWNEEDGKLFADFDEYEGPAEGCLPGYGQAGDRLWVRETFGAHPDYPEALTLPEYEGGHNPHKLIYRADETATLPCGTLKHYGIDFSRIKWKPSIFMPPWASRIKLEVVSSRIERLHAITEEDAKAEGVTLPDAHTICPCKTRVDDPGPHVSSCPWRSDDFDPTDAPNARHRDEFAHLWNAINGKRAPWSANAWVWRVEFRRLA